MSTQELAPIPSTVPPAATGALTAKDKTDIVMALREVARGIEQDSPNTIDLMKAIGTELLVLALKDGSDRPAVAEMVARREVSAIDDSMKRLQHHFITEVEILNERLVRMFDPAMAWNEAINRAITAKQAAREEVILMTPTQKFMFDSLQVPATLKRLKEA
jgi:hypothetical protein